MDVCCDIRGQLYASPLSMSRTYHKLCSLLGINAQATDHHIQRFQSLSRKHPKMLSMLSVFFL